MADLAWLHSLPKTDLHCHLDGSLRLSTLLELCSDLKIQFDPTQFGHNQLSLERYLRLFDVTLAVMQTQSALTRITSELVEDTARENIKYLELRFAPHSHMKGGLSMQQVLEAVSAGMGPTTKMILCAMREHSVMQNWEVAKAVVEYRSLGIVGIDLAGPEKQSLAAEFAECFEYVHRHNMNVTIHAGEASDASSIGDAIRAGHADRIGHGTRLIDSKKLLNEVIERQIPIEVCLSSNRQTGAVKDLAHHPAKQLLEAGACVTLNTDNRLMSATTLTHELQLAQEILGFSHEQIRQVLQNGFQSAFQELTHLPI